MPSPKKLNRQFLELSKVVDTERFANSVRGAFHDFLDYRVSEKTFYPAWYIILGALCGYLSGCNNIQEIAIFMKLKTPWFAELLRTPVKAPSYNVIWTFFVRTKPDEFKKILTKWFTLLPNDVRDQLLVLDGKRIKGASTGIHLTHVVELFASESQITLYQERVPDKKKRIGSVSPYFGGRER
jgi:hypothetical protein